jgi:hypothetical protein
MSDTTHAWMHEVDAEKPKKEVSTTPEKSPAQLVRDHLFDSRGYDFFTEQFQRWAKDERIYNLVVAYVETGEIPGTDMHERRANAGTLATLTGLDWGEAAEIAVLFSEYRDRHGLTVAAGYSTGG